MTTAGWVLGYVRVSTAEQHLDRQLVTIGAVDQLFTDKVSGKKGSARPGLAELQRCARRGDRVRVASLDRLARSLVDLERIVDEFLARGVSVEFVSNRLVFTPGGDDPFATLQRQTLAAYAEFERALLRERQREGIEAAKARGGVYKGREPKFTEDQVVKIRRERATGRSVTALALEYGCSRRLMFDVVNRRGVYATIGAKRPPQLKGAESLKLSFTDAV